jgi:hypothetical protein
LDLIEKKKNLHDTGHRERANNSRQQSDHDVNAIEALFSFRRLGTRIVDEPGPERLKMSILSEEDAPELREWTGSGWSHRRV